MEEGLELLHKLQLLLQMLQLLLQMLQMHCPVVTLVLLPLPPDGSQMLMLI
jgi:hypothetical protein